MDDQNFVLNVYKLLKSIEFSGSYDYSIVIRTCPVCRAYPKGKYSKDGAHREGCLLKKILDKCYLEIVIPMPRFECDAVLDKIEMI